MPENLYRSHSLSVDSEATSGSLTIWEDSPVSPFNVGDTFYPVDNGPALTVEKVFIKDNVIGEVAGKAFRQWEITIEGSSNTPQQEQNTHIKYNFNISDNEKSGTMEVVNSGDNPAVTLNIGDTFSVPGIGEVTCVKVSGSDSYDDYGVHSWNVTYEGSDSPNSQSDDALQDTKYSLEISKDNDGDILKSGSMSVQSTGDAPTFDISVGSTFNIPGIGAVTCSKVTANDDYSEAGAHRWSITYEGFISNNDDDDDNPNPDESNTKYSFALDNDSRSGSVEITSTGANPVFAHNVGDTISLPGVGEVTCVKVSGSASYSDNGKRKWTVIYEGNDDTQSSDDENSNVKFSLSIENNSDGITVYSGSKEFSQSAETPNPNISIGDSFSLPLVGLLTCTKIRSSNDDNGLWNIVIEGSRSGGSSSGDDDDTSLPDSETSITYDLNGSTVRSVSGDFFALRRSETPIIKKSITVYSDSIDPIALPGSFYQGGIVTSENIILETIKNNGVVTSSYYKHSLEVEA